jgi:hypothetical protein
MTTATTTQPNKEQKHCSESRPNIPDPPTNPKKPRTRIQAIPKTPIHASKILSNNKVWAKWENDDELNSKNSNSVPEHELELDYGCG